MKKAIVLLSGGIDSAVTLYVARRDHDCNALIFDYGQRQRREIDCARRVAREAGVPADVVKIPFPWKGSALLDDSIALPEGMASAGGKIPSTYVPARNIVFLSFAISCAEAMGARAVFIGAHQQDYSNYPDCRDEFFESFRRMTALGTKRGAVGDPVEIVTPLLDKGKKDIIRIGRELDVPFELTRSCYESGEEPCGKCEACVIRVRGFELAGISDPALKRKENTKFEYRNSKQILNPKF